MRGRAAAGKRRLEELIAAAWHVAAFDRTKRLPKLAELFQDKRSRQAADDGAVLAMFERLAAIGESS